MKRTSLLVVVFSGILACPLADNLRAMDQAVGLADDGFPRSGQVADAETRAPLSGAIVELPELGIRVISDELGRVDLGRLPTGATSPNGSAGRLRRHRSGRIAGSLERRFPDSAGP